MSTFVHSKEFAEFRKARSNMLLSRKNQLLLEFSFWNEPVPRSGPNIYELRSYQLRVSTEIGVNCPLVLLCRRTRTPDAEWAADTERMFCDVCLARFLPCPVLLLLFPFFKSSFFLLLSLC